MPCLGGAAKHCQPNKHLAAISMPCLGGAAKQPAKSNCHTISLQPQCLAWVGQPQAQPAGSKLAAQSEGCQEWQPKSRCQATSPFAAAASRAPEIRGGGKKCNGSSKRHTQIVRSRNVFFMDRYKKSLQAWGVKYKCVEAHACLLWPLVCRVPEE